MEPYIPWPPTPDELDELGEELSFGATVWNATTQSTDPKKTSALLEAVIEMFSTGEPRERMSLHCNLRECGPIHAADRRGKAYIAHHEGGLLKRVLSAGWKNGAETAALPDAAVAVLRACPDHEFALTNEVAPDVELL